MATVSAYHMIITKLQHKLSLGCCLHELCHRIPKP